MMLNVPGRMHVASKASEQPNIILYPSLLAFRPWLVCQSLDSALAHIELEDHVQLDFRKMFLLGLHIPQQKGRHVETFILCFMMLDLLRNIRKQRGCIDLLVEVMRQRCDNVFALRTPQQFPKHSAWEAYLPKESKKRFVQGKSHPPAWWWVWSRCLRLES